MANTLSVDRTIARAKGLAKRGAFAEADRLYRNVLQRYPGNRRAAEGLEALRKPAAPASPRSRSDYAERARRAIALERAGQREEARATAFAVARDYPDDVQLRYLAGTISLELGHLNDAIEALGGAVTLQPTLPNAYNNLGIAYHRAGQLDEAALCFERAIEQAGEPVGPMVNLAMAFSDNDKPAKALDILRQAVALDPSHINARRTLGNVLRDSARPEDAIAEYRTILDTHPDDAETHNNLGNTFRRIARHAEALYHLERAIAIRPDFAEAHNNRAVVVAELGRNQDACDGYRTALALQPDYTEVYRNLSRLKRYRPGDPDIEAMQALLDSPGTGPEQRLHLHFALFKAYDDIVDGNGTSDDTTNVDTAFFHLAAGNALRKARTPFDPEKVWEASRKSLAFFAHGTPRMLGRDAVRPTDKAPIFVVGMPRSGTTLTEQILANHSAVDPIGEANVLDRALSEVGRDLHGCTASTTPVDALMRLRAAYQEGIAPYEVHAPFVVDKMLSNHRWVGLIAMAFPDARIIDVRRDAMSTCWSIYKHYFASRGNDYAYDQRDVAFYYKLYLQRMAFWDEVLPGRVFPLNYAALTADPEGTARRLLAHCGLPYEDACLSFHTSGRAVITASSQQVRQGLYRSDATAWRRYEHHLEPMLEALAPLIAPDNARVTAPVPADAQHAMRRIMTPCSRLSNPCGDDRRVSGLRALHAGGAANGAQNPECPAHRPPQRRLRRPCHRHRPPPRP